MRFISSEGFTLSPPMSNECYMFLYELRCDPDVMSNTFSYMPFTYTQHVDYLTMIEKSETDKIFLFEVVNEKVGAARISHIDYRSGTCYVGGDITSEYRGRGYGRKMYNTIFEFCKNNLNMRKLYLEVLVSNENAYQLYRKIGFQICGAYKAHVFKDGEYQDVLVMEKFLDK